MACGPGYIKKAAFVAVLIFVVLNMFDGFDPRIGCGTAG